MSALRHRILVIDDEPQIHRFLGPALDAAGYEALRADSGQEGLRGIALWSPDAVVLDLTPAEASALGAQLAITAAKETGPAE